MISLPYSEPFSGVQELGLLLYQIKIVIKPYKTDEFVKSTRSFARKIRKEKGCFGYSVYRDIEKENTFSVFGEWRTHPAMQKHFKIRKKIILDQVKKLISLMTNPNTAHVQKLSTLCQKVEPKSV